MSSPIGENTDARDRAYCQKCIYCVPGRMINFYLCDYYLYTKKMRGGKAGRGCKKRVLKQKKK